MRKQRQRTKRTRPPAPPVPAAYRRPETNPYLRKKKEAILKRLNFQYRSVDRQRDLAICLMALGRTAEALQILEFAYRNVRFRGKYGAWYAAASACCVAGYLRRQRKGHQRPEPELQRFFDPPAHAILFQPDIWTAACVRSHLAEERRRFGPRFDDPDPGTALEALAWWAATLIFFHEMALAGWLRQGRLDVKRLRSRIADALARIRKRLQGRPGEPS